MIGHKLRRQRSSAGLFTCRAWISTVSIKKTVTLDDDVVARITRESKLRGESFGDTLNDLLRSALPEIDNSPNRRTITIKPTHMGYKRGPDHDSIESLIEYGEGEQNR
jgi:hypothetical protein